MIGRGAARMPAVRLTTQILQAEQHRQRRKMARHLLLGSQWRAGTVVMQGHVHNSAAAHGVGAGFMDRLTIRARMIEAQRELAIVPNACSFQHKARLQTNRYESDAGRLSPAGYCAMASIT
jgi:hypothetical protein